MDKTGAPGSYVPPSPVITGNGCKSFKRSLVYEGLDVRGTHPNDVPADGVGSNLSLPDA